jgi:hypothetical protein
VSRRSVIRRAKIARISKLERALHRATLDQICIDTMLYGSGLFYVENKMIHRVSPHDIRVERDENGRPNPVHIRPDHCEIGGLVILSRCGG